MKIKCKQCGKRFKNVDVDCTNAKCQIKYPHSVTTLNFDDVKDDDIEIVEINQSPETIIPVYEDATNDIWDQHNKQYHGYPM